jgi:hypothetical protein
MMKRKSSTQGELRTSPIVLSMAKVPKVSLENWGISRSQTYFPPLECLFKTDSIKSIHDYGIRFPDPISSVIDENQVRLLSGNTVRVHKKITMLLNRYKWMKGEYGMIGLPTSKVNADMIHTKLQSQHNAGYVGSILSVALSQSGCQHFPKVYGVFTGTSSSYKFDISDDYEELCERDWFSQNIGKTFNVSLSESVGHTIAYSRTGRTPIMLGEDIEMDDVEELEGIGQECEHTMPAEMIPVMTLEDVPMQDDNDDSTSLSTSYVFNIESIDTDDIEEDDDTPMDEEEDDDAFAWATVSDVPVQTTVMEMCDGLFYKLLKDNPDTEKHVAWLSQVIFALAFAQRNFGFTHIDLHAYNIMYVKTSEEYFYYTHAGLHYRVPTYGYLIKIIDFDRSIGSIRIARMKESKLFMADQFHHKEEAGGQYNMVPFYHPKYPTVKANPSFDLVRLATSLFWDLFPYGPKYDEYLENPIFRMFIRWMTLEDGTSVYFHNKQPKAVRYAGFDIYKAISRYCKDTAIPRKEILELKQFVIESMPIGVIPLIIDV